MLCLQYDASKMVSGSADKKIKVRHTRDGCALSRNRLMRADLGFGEGQMPSHAVWSSRGSNVPSFRRDAHHQRLSGQRHQILGLEDEQGERDLTTPVQINII